MREAADTPDTPRASNDEAREAAAMGEKPDLGHERDALIEALTGSGVGSDTRAGSLRGGSVSGSDIEPDQKVINDALARAGRETAASTPPASVDPSDVKNTGMEPGQTVDERQGSGPKSAEAATG